ncbi:MAG: hypothetical protein GXY83_01915 [Rhodopirellula sp.]|nr:hypothetical protein [Rhodopirellula sp.]
MQRLVFLDPALPHPDLALAPPFTPPAQLKLRPRPPLRESRKFVKKGARPSGIWTSLPTLRRKVRQFKKLRIAGLKRKPRTDRGGIRKHRRAMLERAIQLKRQQPRRSPLAINKILVHEFGRTIPKATLNRQLRQAGVTRKKLADPQPVIRYLDIQMHQAGGMEDV